MYPDVQKTNRRKNKKRRAPPGRQPRARIRGSCDGPKEAEAFAVLPQFCTPPLFPPSTAYVSAPRRPTHLRSAAVPLAPLGVQGPWSLWGPGGFDSHPLKACAQASRPRSCVVAPRWLRSCVKPRLLHALQALFFARAVPASLLLTAPRWLGSCLAGRRALEGRSTPPFFATALRLRFCFQPPGG